MQNIGNIYIYLILYLFKKNKINLLNYNLKINKVDKKNIIFFFLYFKKKIKKIIDFNRIKDFGLSGSGLYVNFWNDSSRKKSLNTFNSNTNIKNILLPKYSLKSTEGMFIKLFRSYCTLFSMFSLKDSSFFNKFFYFYIKKRKERVSFLNYFIFKNNFLKTVHLMFNIIYMNYLPNIITESDFEKSLIELNEYCSFILTEKSFGFTFCTSAYVKLKKINKARNLNVPLIAIADLNTNPSWIDYPILIAESNKVNSYYFFCLALNLFFSSLHYKRKKYMYMYNDFKKLNFLKEFILKNEYKQ